MKKILLILIIVGVLIYLVMGYINRDTYENGIFTSKEYGFELSFPQRWHEADKKEALKTSTERLMVRNIDTRVFLTFSNPDDAVFVVSILPGDKESFSKATLDDVAGKYGSIGMKVEFKEQVDIGGFNIIRVGGPFGKDQQYMQVNFFSTEEGVVQLLYVCKDSHYGETIEEVNSAVLSLRGI